MSVRQTLTAPCYDLFREPVLRFIRNWAKAGEVLIVAAERAAADEWAREACQGALLGVHRMTLSQAAAALSGRAVAAAGAAPVTRVAVEAIAARVTGQALAEGRLHYFEPVARTPGFATALAGTLAELRLDRIAPAALAQAGGPGADLAILLELYGAELRERSLVDLADQFTAALEVAEAGAHPLCGLPLLEIDAEPESALEKALMETLAERAPATLAARLGAAESEPSSSLESLQHYLFAETVPPRAADESVDLFAASGEALECVEIARRIARAAEAGTPFDGAAILLRSPERYQPMVEEALRRAGIPGFFARGSRRPYASGRAFLALLECAREGLSASRFAEYLSLGQLPGDDQAGDERHHPAPVHWERLLVDAAVTGGIDRWRRRLDGLAAELRTRHDAAEEEADRTSAGRQMELLESLASFALPVVERLAALPERASWGEWMEELRELALATLRHPEAVEELLDELQPMSDLGPVTLDDVLLATRPRLRSLRQPAEGSRYGKVWVSAIDEARGMAFDLVFLPGLNEGSFPRPPAEDPLLLDRFREAIPGARRRSRDDNELLAIAAGCARWRLTISYSRLDLVTGRQRVPSFYVFEALRAARGENADVRDIEREAERGAHTRIGWPAPRDPAEAIDDAEFDLAVLRPAFDDPAARPGAAAYLAKVNRLLLEALRARYRRWSSKWTANDGLVARDAHEWQALERHRLTARAWSASALQQYAACPYRFALRSIFDLHPAERPQALERMDPALRGEIFHRAHFELMGELRDAGALPVVASTLAAALERLDRVVDRVGARFREKVAPAIPHVWETEVEALRADLRGWLRQSAHQSEEWTPAWFEFAFGVGKPEDHDPDSLPEPVEIAEGALLRGSIDLIERGPGGVLRVVDFKTGALPPKPVQAVGGGEVLQPALYALAAETALHATVATGRLTYATLRRNFRSLDVPLGEFTRQRAAQALRVIDDAIRTGFLPAAPREEACKNCDYLPVCGPYEEERSGRKPAAELKPLRDMRRWS